MRKNVSDNKYCCGDDYRPVVTFSPQCCTCKKLHGCPTNILLCYRDNVIMCKRRTPIDSKNDYIYPPEKHIRPYIADEIREEAKTYPKDLRNRTLSALNAIERKQQKLA